jgi:hypothetical protein
LNERGARYSAASVQDMLALGIVRRIARGIVQRLAHVEGGVGKERTAKS